ncbi:MAG: integrase core domain-containing protein [Candidatus Bipolaricaulota bacterium]
MREVLINQNAPISYPESDAKENHYIGSFHSSIKREGKVLFLGARNILELRYVVEERFQYYNQDRRHPSLDYLSSINYLKLEKTLPEEAKYLVKIGR